MQEATLIGAYKVWCSAARYCSWSRQKEGLTFKKKKKKNKIVIVLMRMVMERQAESAFGLSSSEAR